MGCGELVSLFIHTALLLKLNGKKRKSERQRIFVRLVEVVSLSCASTLTQIGSKFTFRICSFVLNEEMK